MGSARGLERTLVPRTGIPCFFVPMSPPASALGPARMARAVLASLRVIRRWRPNATIATGGYVSAPVALASWICRVPVVLFLPDVVPGKAVAFLAPLARRIAVSTDRALTYLPREKTVTTGYPVRREFYQATRDDARRRFSLAPDDRVLCVFGGSQGSRSINQALERHLSRLLSRCHVIHVSGEARLPEAEAAAAVLTPDQRSRYRLFPYLHDSEMADALAAADLAVCRSGASVLGELPATGTPAILVPLPARGVHQLENAEYLADAGAAILVHDDNISTRLADLVDELLEEPERLQRMRDAALGLRRPDAAARIVSLVERLAT
ncbi:MAG TPA: UDP-N-acetylglucosamine--N-acetylmuramyl-(pentapeptide) pyrophosphoryl-undecaprenol N-acetylglucosamine transferase [Chloroflexota bacterium]|nr:UDP-N-acetylglucosamine--N-acetylmuramyl-(pentapeptide) pyrophosphoryl-undecaprenol N-acetylglucosamine transferase [Chloroflexota bacterium]